MPTDTPVMTDPALTELSELLRNGDLLLFVGAGASAAAGLPTWGRLVRTLCEHARIIGAPQPLLAEAEALNASGQCIDALSAVEHAIGPSEFANVIERELRAPNKMCVEGNSSRS